MEQIGATSVVTPFIIITQNNRVLYEIPKRAHIGIFTVHCGPVDVFLSVDIGVTYWLPDPVYRFPLEVASQVNVGDRQLWMTAFLDHVRYIPSWLSQHIVLCPVDLRDLLAATISKIAEEMHHLDSLLSAGIARVDMGNFV